MNRFTFVALSFLLLSPGARGQNTSAESPTMQALLAEVHQLRQDLQASAIAARRAQIVIYRLHVQEAAVARATEHLENAKATLAQLQMQRKYQAEQIKRYEEMKERAVNEEERKQFDDTISQFRTQMEMFDSAEPELRAKEAEDEEEFRNEQAKLERLQDELDRLDKALEDFALQASSRQH